MDKANNENFIELIRVSSDDEGTLGFLLQDDTLICWTMECPWRNNEPFESCIPCGDYDVVDHYVKDVPDRTFIKFHVGNWAGDENKRHRSNSKGCILPGMYPKSLLNQKAVISSIQAMKRVPSAFKLRVINYYEF